MDASTQTPPDTEPLIDPEAKAKRSCDYCVKYKRRCDGGRPFCSTCFRSRKSTSTCRYSERKKPGRKSRKPQEEQSEDVSNKRMREGGSSNWTGFPSQLEHGSFTQEDLVGINNMGAFHQQPNLNQLSSLQQINQLGAPNRANVLYQMGYPLSLSPQLTVAGPTQIPMINSFLVSSAQQQPPAPHPANLVGAQFPQAQGLLALQSSTHQPQPHQLINRQLGVQLGPQPHQPQAQGLLALQSSSHQPQPHQLINRQLGVQLGPQPHQMMYQQLAVSPGANQGGSAPVMIATNPVPSFDPGGFQYQANQQQLRRDQQATLAAQQSTITAAPPLHLAEQLMGLARQNEHARSMQNLQRQHGGAVELGGQQTGHQDVSSQQASNAIFTLGEQLRQMQQTNTGGAVEQGLAQHQQDAYLNLVGLLGDLSQPQRRGEGGAAPVADETEDNLERDKRQELLNESARDEQEGLVGPEGNKNQVK